MLELWRASLSRPSKRLADIVLPGLLLVGCLGDQSPILPASNHSEGEIAPRINTVQRASDQEHQRLLTAFGGEYRAPRARAALDEIVQRLAKAGEGQIGHYEITILNSPVVNAFALPNGRLYVTRGLLALANDTSEIASVLAHGRPPPGAQLPGGCGRSARTRAICRGADDRPANRPRLPKAFSSELGTGSREEPKGPRQRTYDNTRSWCHSAVRRNADWHRVSSCRLRAGL